MWFLKRSYYNGHSLPLWSLSKALPSFAITLKFHLRFFNSPEPYAFLQNITSNSLSTEHSVTCCWKSIIINAQESGQSWTFQVFHSKYCTFVIKSHGMSWQVISSFLPVLKKILTVFLTKYLITENQQFKSI